MHYLYVTTNDLTGQKYVGQRKCPINKTPESDNYFGSGTRLINAIKKYGSAYFSKEVIEICETQCEIDILEIDYIRENKVLENKEQWYNLDAGGQYGRSEEHSIIVSARMKKLYENPEIKTKLIKRKNAQRVKNGLNKLPYDSYQEYVESLTLKNTLRKISKANQRKRIKIKSLKRVSKENTKIIYMDSDIYKEQRRNISIKANVASCSQVSITKRKKSQIISWNKRKEQGNVWNDNNKNVFAIGKLNQYHNPIALYLMNNGVSLRIDGLQKKVKKCYKPYKNIINMYKQIDNIILTVSKTHGIRINKQELTSIVLESRMAVGSPETA